MTVNRAFLFIAAILLLTAGRYQPRQSSGGLTIVDTYPWRFAYLTDVHCRWNFGGGAGVGVRNDFQLGKVIDTLNVLNAKVMVIGGDWAEDVFIQNNNANVDSFITKMSRFTGVILPCMGNHEATATDTLLGRDPYYTSRQRFADKFQGKNWFKYDYRNVRFISLQNSANYNVGSLDDYRVNNPRNYAPPVGSGGIQGYDWDGITVPSSLQRLDMALWTKRTDVGAKWIIPIFHRAIYGANTGATTRQNLGVGAKGYIKAIEDSLPTGRRGLVFYGDQHHLYMYTKAIRDSAVAAATGKGMHHLTLASGSGSRPGDSTSVPAGFYDSYVWRLPTLLGNIAGSTTGTAIDTLTTIGAPCGGGLYGYTWALFTVYGDMMMMEVFFVWQSCDATNNRYPGNGAMTLVHREYIQRDVD